MPKVKLPSFQFYPGDWLKDAELRRCSHAAKGVWIDMLCLMFECDERGVLATAGRAWTFDEIVRAVGGEPELTLSCLHELLEKRVARRRASLGKPDCSVGAIYSARMVRDEEQRKRNAERVRRHRSSDDVTPVKRPCNAPCNGDVTPLKRASSSSSSPSGLAQPPPKARDPNADGVLAQVRLFLQNHPRMARAPNDEADLCWLVRQRGWRWCEAAVEGCLDEGQANPVIQLAARERRNAGVQPPPRILESVKRDPVT